MATAKPHWQIDTEKLAREFRTAAASARTEEDLKLRIAPLLQRVLRDSGIDVDAVQYEKATALSAKRMDAVYGYLIIESRHRAKSPPHGTALLSLNNLRATLPKKQAVMGNTTRGSWKKQSAWPWMANRFCSYVTPADRKS